MTQELTPAQRLNQIEKILESAIKLSHSNTSKIDANTEGIKANKEALANLTQKSDLEEIRFRGAPHRTNGRTNQHIY